MSDRTHNSIRNIFFALVGQVLTVVFSFITQTVFIKTLGATYLGINGLFSNVLSLLSFAELGVGTAITFAMYKPLAENNKDMVCALMNFYAKAYRAIGLGILILGLLLVPLLPHLLSKSSVIPNGCPPLWLIYFLYLLNSSSSYFFNYKRTLIIASQNGHLDSINQFVYTFLRNSVQIALLIVFRAFLPYLLIQILFTLMANITISRRADKLFPYLSKGRHKKLPKAELHKIVRNVLSLAMNKCGSVIISGTDNILITKFVNLVATGYYSNYQLLTSTLMVTMMQLTTPLTASIGNFMSSKTKEESYSLFKKLFFAIFYLTIFCSVGLAVLANPFIELIWGSEYLLPVLTVFLIMLNFYLNQIRRASQLYIDTCGLFWPVRWKTGVEAIVNLSSSLLFAGALHMGIQGVMLGNIASNILVNIWWEPYIVYRYKFHLSLRNYFKKFFVYFLLFVTIYSLCESISTLLPDDLIGFIFKICAVILVTNLVILFLFRKTVEFGYLKRVAKYYLGKIKNKS